MSAPIICSGLGAIAPCPKRKACIHFKHWTDDPRADFSACREDETLPKFVPRDAAPEPVAGQSELFA